MKAANEIRRGHTLGDISRLSFPPRCSSCRVRPGAALHHRGKVSGKPRCLHSLEIQIHLLDHVQDGGQLEVSCHVMGEGWLSGREPRETHKSWFPEAGSSGESGEGPTCRRVAGGCSAEAPARLAEGAHHTLEGIYGPCLLFVPTAPPFPAVLPPPALILAPQVSCSPSPPFFLVLYKQRSKVQEQGSKARLGTPLAKERAWSSGWWGLTDHLKAREIPPGGGRGLQAKWEVTHVVLVLVSMPPVSLNSAILPSQALIQA